MCFTILLFQKADIFKPLQNFQLLSGPNFNFQKIKRAILGY